MVHPVYVYIYIYIGAVLRHGSHGSCHAFFKHGRVSRIWSQRIKKKKEKKKGIKKKRGKKGRKRMKKGKKKTKKEENRMNSFLKQIIKDGAGTC